jgi:uroporphyrin-III C-methyltransferase
LRNTVTSKDGQASKDIALASQLFAIVIMLMAMSKREAIVEIYSTRGKEINPVAIIQEGTTENEKSIIWLVKDIFCKAQYHCISNRAIIMIGDVVKLTFLLN